jgi:WD40 repeat protein
MLGASVFTADGSIFASTQTGVALWHATGTPDVRLAAHVYDHASLSRDGSLAAIPIDGTAAVELRELRTGALWGRLVSSAPILSAGFAADGRVVTSGEAGLVEIWAPGGRRLAALTGHTAAVNTAMFSGDDRRVASASRDRTARVWDVATRRELARVTHNDEVVTASFDPAGQRLVTASVDGTVGLWDIVTSRRLQTFAHPRAVLAATIDRSGALVAAATSDGTISLWDVEKGQELARFHHGATAKSADFGAAGLLTTSLDHCAIVWDVAVDIPDPAAVAAFVRCHVPYELRDARLVPVVPPDCSGGAVTPAVDVTVSDGR